MSTLSNESITRIIINLIRGEDYRGEVVGLIDSAFLNYANEFLRKVLNAKFNNIGNGIDWYKNEFLNENLEPKEISINSGLNMKSIKNKRRSTRKEVVLEEAKFHFDQLHESIDSIEKNDGKFSLELTLRYNGSSVDLNFVESLIVMNTLAVSRSALRGGLWSTAGKSVESPLMVTLCKLFGVNSSNYSSQSKQSEIHKREVDFCLKTVGVNINCEVKLMGEGNPESADAGLAREPKLFVADTLSKGNKLQFDKNGIEWVELRRENGFLRFGLVLDKFGIPRSSGDVDVSTANLTNIIAETLKELKRT